MAEKQEQDMISSIFHGRGAFMARKLIQMPDISEMHNVKSSVLSRQ